MTGILVLWWVFVGIGLAGSALCSGLEVGMYSINRVRLQVRSRIGSHVQAISKLRNELDQPARVLTSLLIFNNMFNYLATLAITALLSMRGLGDVWIIVFQAAILTPVILVLCEAIPKEVFRGNADRMMPKLWGVLVFARVTLTAALVLPMLLWIARSVAGLIGVDPKNAVRSGREQMAELLKYGAKDLSDEQVTMIDRALVFEHSTVRQRMSELQDARTVDHDWSASHAAKKLVGGRGRWAPVRDKSRTIIGMVSVLDLHSGGDESVRDRMVEPVRIDGSSSVRRGLEELNGAGVPVGVVVVDGQDMGIVTIQDLVEPLMGSFSR
ncbi:MAG: DUF21 domain-containing protein [Phycisphaerales bacterium]|nr:DUF21 domain-containing protein [Phycisphaerales bacterium]